jgi:UDP-2,4-diacetamido-2,4,6-trideoxy-beta-L-altropyranose hydrolase
MKIVIRADASSTIGTGHVMRCLTLAQGIRRAGGHAVFVCRELPGHLCNEISARGFEVLRLPADSAGPTDDGPPHAAWLGTSWRNDAAQTRAALSGGEPADWLVVDHYALDSRWESAMRPAARQLMVIDDMFDRAHDADLLLNQNVLPGTTESYAALAPAACRLLTGPRYALLNARYRELRNRIPPRRGRIERVLVYFGGVDAANLTGRSLEALLAAGCGDLGIDVVLPVAGPHRESVRTLAGRLAGARIHETLPSLSQLMATADLAIGAGGTTSWERLCLGLPSLVVTLSENQRLIAQALQANDLALWLGHHDTVTVELLTEALQPLLQNGLPPDWSARCRAAVDGAGADRVAALMAIDRHSRLTARPATVEDELLVGDWAISLASRRDDGRWYGDLLRSLGDSQFYVVEAAPGVIVGTVLATFREGAWDLQSQVSPSAAGVCTPHCLEQSAFTRLRANCEGLLQLAVANTPASGSLRIGLCSDQGSWINDFIAATALQWQADGHAVAWAHDAALLPGSDVCFYLSYGRIVGPALRARHGNNLVVHESDLPAGRGWSPLTWQVLQGEQNIVVTLFEAVDAVDAGVIYGQTTIHLAGNELVDELREQQAAATFALCTVFVRDYPGVLQQAREQSGTPNYFPRRTPVNSRLDPDLPLREQFDLLRVCDNTRYPAWFDHAGRRYFVGITRSTDKD